jgi:hypothetical protein
MKRPARFWRRRDRRTLTQVTPREETHVTHEQSPLQLGIPLQVPDSMPRSDDDAATRDRSRPLHNGPGSGKDTSIRTFSF